VTKGGGGSEAASGLGGFYRRGRWRDIGSGTRGI